MPYAFAGADEDLCELEPETLEQLRVHAALLRHGIEQRMAWLAKSRPRRRKTALKLIAANARITASVIDMLSRLDLLTEKITPAEREERPGERDRMRRRIMKKVMRIIAKADKEDGSPTP